MSNYSAALLRKEPGRLAPHFNHMESVFQILVGNWEQRAKEVAASLSEGGCEEELSSSYGCVAKLVCLPLP